MPGRLFTVKLFTDAAITDDAAANRVTSGAIDMTQAARVEGLAWRISSDTVTSAGLDVYHQRSPDGLVWEDYTQNTAVISYAAASLTVATHTVWVIVPSIPDYRAPYLRYVALGISGGNPANTLLDLMAYVRTDWS